MAKANSSVKDLWFQVNRLSVNLDKTCYSIFGHSDVSESLELKIGTTVLKLETSGSVLQFSQAYLIIYAILHKYPV